MWYLLSLIFTLAIAYSIWWLMEWHDNHPDGE
jgi:hypothetical protein